MGIYEIKKPKRINSFSVTIFLIVTIGGYLLYWYIPIWWPVFQVSGIMSGICNDAYREMSNEKLVDKLMLQTKRTGLPLTKDNFIFERVGYLPQELPTDPSARDTLSRRGKKCKLTFNYRKHYDLPFIGKSVPLSWSKSVETDLGIIKY